MLKEDENGPKDDGQGGTGGTGDDQGQQDKDAGEGEAQDVSQLPAWAQKQITDARAEAAKQRTDSKAKQQTAADKAKAEILQTLGQALGLGKDEKPDPERLAADLKDRDGKLATAQRELAVVKLAGKHGADPEALLDSASFGRSLADVDASDADAVGKLIASAVKDNPRFALGRTAGAGGRDLSGSGGSGGSGRKNDDDLSREDIRKMVLEARGGKG